MSDIYGDQTVLLLHCDGADGSTQLLDSSYRNSVREVGNAQISTAQKKFGVSSAYFDGAGDFLELYSGAASLSGESTFTLEMWIRVSDLSAYRSLYYNGNIASNANRMQFAVTNQGVLTLYYEDGAAASDTFSSATGLIVAGQWHHVAASVSLNTVKLFIDGIVVATGTKTKTVVYNTASYIGLSRVGGVSQYFIGYIDEARITKGVARYTAEFTPPTAPFDDPTIFKADDYPLYWDETKLLMHMDGANGSTYFRDEKNALCAVMGNTKISTTQNKFGVSSGYFDGIADGVLTSNIDLGGGDFTIEAWCYFVTTNSSSEFIISKALTSTDYAPFKIGLENGYWRASVSVGTTDYNATNGVVLAKSNFWYHVALVKESGVVRFYINGVLVGSVAQIGQILTNSARVVVGAYSENLSFSDHGYIDEVRITKGIARYTDRFVPPTKAFPDLKQYDPHWNSVVLAMPMNGPNGSTSILDMVDLKGHAYTKTSPSPSLTTAQGKFNSSSLNWSASTVNPYIEYGPSEDFSLGAGDFTLEMWFMVDSVSAVAQNLFYLPNAAGVSTGLSLYTYNGAMTLYVNAATTSTSGIISANIFYHVALVRHAGFIKLYIDGVFRIQLADQTISQNNKVLIGNDPGKDSSAALRGYTNDLRFTKGVARYTGNFTPPTEPFPTTVPEGLSGVVKDSSGNPIQRTARSYRRDTGALIGTAISDPITGLFSLPADNTDEHFVVVFDDVKNALIYDHITPVAP